VPFQKRRHALLVIVSQGCLRKLIDVHVAGEIVERVRQALAASAIAVSKAMPGSATSSTKSPCVD
jgi:hypothetical protein